MYEEYKGLDLEFFSGFVKSFVGYDENAWSAVKVRGKQGDNEARFANRLITGLAAEQYFQSLHHTLPEFKGYSIENTTQLGCGCDFRLRKETNKDFLAVEVKGLKGRVGNLSMTPKEHELATVLTDRFFLFVVKNFKESPYHEIFQNPLSGALRFTKKELITVQISWLAKI